MNIIKTYFDFRGVVKVRLFSIIVLRNNVDDKLLSKLPGVRSLCLNPASLAINTELAPIFRLYKLVWNTAIITRVRIFSLKNHDCIKIQNNK